MTVTVRPIVETDRAAWEDLFVAYATFYKVEQTSAMRATVWGWLHDDSAQTCGLVALDTDGRIVGLAHYRAFARPLAASTGGFLDDLFVDPAHRGSGAADAMIDALCRIGRDRGWSIIRWITADDNYRARNMYDRIAARMGWITYDIKL